MYHSGGQGPRPGRSAVYSRSVGTTCFSLTKLLHTHVTSVLKYIINVKYRQINVYIYHFVIHICIITLFLLSLQQYNIP